MSFNLVDLVKDQIGDQLMGALGGALGTSPEQTSGALSGALPGLLSGLTESASSPAGAGALFDSIQKQDDGMLGNMGNLLGGNNSAQVANQGSSVLESIMGSGALGQLAGVVSSFAGIGRGNSSSLMGILAPIVLGVIKNKLSGGGMNAGSVASMLTGQRANINAAMPQGFSDQLQSSGFFDSLKTANSGISTSATAAPSAAAAPVKSGNGLLRWLIPLAALLVLGWLAMQFLGGNKTDDITALTPEALQESMPEGVDFDTVTSDLNGVFSSTTDSLNGITDADSAVAALPAIEEATGKLGGLNDVISGLPDIAKGPVASIVQNGLAALQPLVEKVSAIPGVGDIITPVIQPVMEMLEGLAS